MGLLPEVENMVEGSVAVEANATGSPGPLFAGTKASVFRRMVLRHMAHHRRRLTVYRRLVGASVPATYGPTAERAE